MTEVHIILERLVPVLAKTFSPPLTDTETVAIGASLDALEAGIPDKEIVNATAAQIVRQMRSQSAVEGGSMVNAIPPMIFGLGDILPRWGMLKQLVEVIWDLSKAPTASAAENLISGKPPGIRFHHLTSQVVEASSPILSPWIVLAEYADGLLAIVSALDYRRR